MIFNQGSTYTGVCKIGISISPERLVAILAWKINNLMSIDQVSIGNDFVRLKFKLPRKDLVAIIGLKNQLFYDLKSRVNIYRSL